jgi:GH15 family glucan-1,4-alpha-glucosidase
MVSADPGVIPLDLALVGNGTIGALIDPRANVVWCCFPRFDGDPVFCSLLQGKSPHEGGDPGAFGIDLIDAVKTEQQYLADTPILVTRCHDANGGSIEITDFAPRFEKDGKLFCPVMLVRQVRRLAGKPTIRLRVHPAARYGCRAREYALGANHITYTGDDQEKEGAEPLRLLTNAPTATIVDEIAFPLTDTVTLCFGAEARIEGEVANAGSRMLEQTRDHWARWVGALTVPAEWREAVVRAAITLQLNVFEETGAIIAAMTTSIPEAPDSGRTWDYRYCWPRDAWFVVDALSRLGDLRTTPRYLRFLLSVAEKAKGADSRLKPMYAIDGGPIPEERVAECLSGYRGMGPVRVGNAASDQLQHDIYGEAVLTAEPMFLSAKSGARADERIFERLEKFGEHAAKLFDVPDAGLWELRGKERVHTFSSLMCWAACDRLAQYASAIGLDAREDHWRGQAKRIRSAIESRSWNEKLQAYTAAMDGDTLDASLLLMPQLGFLKADDPRFVGTVAAIERDLKHGDFVYRYVERDHLGRPENAFLVCTFWYISALSQMGRRDEAKKLFEKVLSARNRHGLLAEDLDPQTHEQWGNFVQTYSMAGIIDCALRLSS